MKDGIRKESQVSVEAAEYAIDGDDDEVGEEEKEYVVESILEVKDCGKVSILFPSYIKHIQGSHYYRVFDTHAWSLRPPSSISIF